MITTPLKEFIGVLLTGPYLHIKWHAEAMLFQSGILLCIKEGLLGNCFLYKMFEAILTKTNEKGLMFLFSLFTYSFFIVYLFLLFYFISFQQVLVGQ